MSTSQADHTQGLCVELYTCIELQPSCSAIQWFQSRTNNESDRLTGCQHSLIITRKPATNIATPTKTRYFRQTAGELHTKGRDRATDSIRTSRPSMVRLSSSLRPSIVDKHPRQRTYIGHSILASVLAGSGTSSKETRIHHTAGSWEWAQRESGRPFLVRTRESK
jgi:hypothetical protein